MTEFEKKWAKLTPAQQKEAGKAISRDMGMKKPKAKKTTKKKTGGK